MGKVKKKQNPRPLKDNKMVDKAAKKRKVKPKVADTKNQDCNEGIPAEEAELLLREDDHDLGGFNEDGDEVGEAFEDAEGGDGGADDANYGNFMKDIAGLEGAPRFLHYSDDRDFDGNLSQALGLSAGQEVPIDTLLGDLPSTKAGANIKKDLKKFAGQETKSDKRKKRKRRKEAEGGDQEDKDEKSASKSLRLPAPLSAPDQERTARSALYARAKEDVKVWDSVVHSGRAADTKKFPLVKPDLRIVTSSEKAAYFRPRNALEEQVMSLLRKSNKAEESSRLSHEEEAELAQMSLREAEEKRREIIRLKVLQSHQEAKLKRQNKIKSKKYRKLMRKQREKERQKELEELKATDPEAAAERMREEERVRITERATLRHRNSSKYLQMQARRAKGDKESQLRLNEAIAHHRSLTAKHYEDDQVEDQGVDGAEAEEGADMDQEEVGEFNANFKKFWKEQNAAKAVARAKAEALKTQKERERLEMASSSIDDLFSEADRVMRKKLAGSAAGADGNESNEEEEVFEEEDESLTLKTDANREEQRKKNEEEAKKKKEKKAASLDPDKFVQKVKKTTTIISSEGNCEGEEEGDDSAEDFEAQAAAISEAFAGDDVLADFASEKKTEVDKDRPKDVDLSLPGWGSWGGADIRMSKRKRRRFTVRAPPPPKRKDENRGHLILNEREDEKLKRHQVSDVPFPFTSVADFEASVRTPIGDTFVPRTAFKNFIKPRVETKVGAVIDPMDDGELVKRRIV